MIMEMNFNLDDFEKSNWRNVIQNAQHKTCQSYFSVLSVALQDLNENGVSVNYQIYFLFLCLCSLHLEPAKHVEPLTAKFKYSDGSCSFDISDLNEQHILLLKVIFDHVDDPELKARIGDVIWCHTRNGNFRYAEAAIIAYLESADRLLNIQSALYSSDRFERALHLATELGRNSQKYKEVVNRIEQHLIEYEIFDSPLIGNLLDLLYEFRQGNPEICSRIAVSIAKNEQERGQWYSSRLFWQRAADWFRRSELVEDEHSCLISVAECFVLEAQNKLTKSEDMSRSVAAHLIQSAIESLRKVPGTEAQQKALHFQMLELQESSVNEFGTISGQVDLTQFVEKAILTVKDKTFLEALFTLSALGSSPKKTSLREMVEKLVDDHPILYFMSMNVVNDKGKVVGRRNSLFSGKPEEIEAATIAEMHSWAKFEQQTIALVINACRLQILQEHTCNIRELLELTIHNPFIPLGRELIYARGFQAGFCGEFLEALHLLVPQIENSLRYILKRADVITTSLSSEGIQEELDLNALLGKPELIEILGEDLVFDLQGALTSRFGSNIRNRLAHGLMDHDEFYSYTAVYIWWLLLRICCIPLINSQYKDEEKDATSPSE